MLLYRYILDQSYFDSVQADMTLLSYLVEMGMVCTDPELLDHKSRFI